jgi:magnesium chelatase subunit H
MARTSTQLVDSSAFGDEDELADAYEARKSFAYGVNGKAAKRGLLQRRWQAMSISPIRTSNRSSWASPRSITTSTRWAASPRGEARQAAARRPPIYISDTTRGAGKVRTLKDQVALETRSRSLNPKWFEGHAEARP